MSEIKLIPLKNIDPSPDPIRELDADQVSDLTESLVEHGMLQPVFVRPKGNRFEIVFGNHRYYAAKRTDIDEIPCIIREIGDDEALLLSIIENIQRANINPASEGRAYKRLLNKYKIKELSKKISKSVQYILGRIKIVEKLHPELIKEVGSELTITNALHLSDFSPIRQLELFEQIKKYRNNPGGSHFGGGVEFDPETCVCPKCGARHLKRSTTE